MFYIVLTTSQTFHESSGMLVTPFYLHSNIPFLFSFVKNILTNFVSYRNIVFAILYKIYKQSCCFAIYYCKTTASVSFSQIRLVCDCHLCFFVKYMDLICIKCKLHCIARSCWCSWLNTSCHVSSFVIEV